ncbi:hypothetical protein [Paraliomyxa miuraensis]|uniref:hypothetical protein n=1 Tax=Paraliomyxa miuraensis TaxID=376150 RepID=UPI00224D7415|nr:hypothetical protein [Paraliomyxa miuraensis]MCX4242516.1 hypothetical protein [Paraliomyxa miuraensis]
MSAIVPLAKTHVVERHDQRLATAWVRTERAPTPALAGRWLTHEGEPTRRSTEPDPEGPVLVMLGSSSSPAMAEFLAYGRSGARVYVLAPSWWEPTAPALRGCPKVLVRRVAEVPVSAVLTVHGARVWMGSTVGGPTPWALRLDDEQAAALRQLFLRAFWHDAIDETWTGPKPPRLRAAATRPFDVPDPPARAAVRLVDANTILEAFTREQHVHLNGGEPPTTRLRRLWIPPGGSHHAQLAHLVREGATVAWDELGLPEVATDGRSGIVLLPGARHRLRIELSPPQAAELAARLDEPGAWSFGLDLRLGDHTAEGTTLWIDGAETTRAIEPQQVLELPDISAPEIRGMDAVVPAQWPAAHPLSLTIHYGWTVHPPRVPTKAKEDPMIERWRRVDEHWASRVAGLEQLLTAADDHRGRLASISSRLLGAVAGFGRAHEQLQREVEALAAQRPSEAGPAEANDRLRRLEELEGQAGRLRSEQDDAEHEARVEDERARQETEWTARVAKARRELPSKRSELDEAEARRGTLGAELADVEQALNATDVGKQARKDLRARLRKLGDDLARHDRRIKGLHDALDECRRQVDEKFSFTPPTRSGPTPKGPGGRFVPTATTASTVAVPEEALPEVGNLMCLKDQRYLVIDTWEHLELGEPAARRLSARLVASEVA